MRRYRGLPPRTRAPAGGDGRDKPEIASMAPDLPNPNGMRRMRGGTLGSVHPRGLLSKSRVAGAGGTHVVATYSPKLRKVTWVTIQSSQAPTPSEAISPRQKKRCTVVHKRRRGVKAAKKVGR